MAGDACSFCLIVAGEDRKVREAYRTDHVVAFQPTDPATLGHLLVIPRRHVANIWGLNPSEADHLAQATLLLSDVLREAVHPDGLNIIQSNGEAATQTVPHLHVHLVPRFADDSMGLIWPEDTNFADKELNHVQEVVKKLVGEKTHAGEKTSVPRFTITPEDHRKHLDLIQTVIARQSSASASAKSWLLPIITATFGFALTQESWGLGAIGAVVIILFALLDANYLHSERLFRNLYAEVIRPGNQVPLYSLNPLDVPAPDSATEKATRESRKKPRRSSLPPWSAWSSWSIAPFYSALLIMSLVVMFAASSLNISSLIRVLTEFIC